jgi:hypothetical protein
MYYRLNAAFSQQPVTIAPQQASQEPTHHILIIFHTLTLTKLTIILLSLLLSQREE